MDRVGEGLAGESRRRLGLGQQDRLQLGLGRGRRDGPRAGLGLGFGRGGRRTLNSLGNSARSRLDVLRRDLGGGAGARWGIDLRRLARATPARIGWRVSPGEPAGPIKNHVLKDIT